MGWRFRKRIKIFSGLYINISKSGLGVNIGPKGANVSIGPNGTYVNTGIPGTGLYRRDKINSSKHPSTAIQQESQDFRGQEVFPNIEKKEQQSGRNKVYLQDKHHTFVNQEDNHRTPHDVDITHLDPLFEDAARLIVKEQRCSCGLIMRNFAIGYNRVVRLMNQLEKAGIVGVSYGSTLRDVLITDDRTLEYILSHWRQ